MVEKKDNIISRPPVVVFLGHVDHGKSSILEAIKDLKITEKESGGITQHIGAYNVEHNDKRITFIDTPGHEAFSSMRSRGAKVADIAVLVVAADDGVKTQTKEAIAHIKKAGVPMVVAINKIDKPEADFDRISQQLSEQEIYLESIGGKVPFVKLSAKTREGINDLLELILLVAEMEDLSTDSLKEAEGIIVESHIDSFKGPIATVIIESGTLKRGDTVATSSCLGKIKSLENSQGKAIDHAGPSMPAAVLGFEEVPVVGDSFKSFSNVDLAKKYMEEKKIEKEILAEKEVKIQGEEQINIILKADFFGSLEAIEGMLKEIPQERMSVKIVKSEVGDINETDVKLAKSIGADILGFRVKTMPSVRGIIERDKINVYVFDIIYELIETVRKIMESAITPKIERTDLGKAKVLVVFFTGKNKQIVGCKVLDGEIKNSSRLEIFRINLETEEEEKISLGKITGLKKGERVVEKISAGEECGISYEGGAKLEVGDILVSYIEEKEKIQGI